MNPAKGNDYDYIHFLIGTPRTYTCTEAARVQPQHPNPPAHDALTHLLYRLEPSPEQWWADAQEAVQLHEGLLVIDDSVVLSK